MRRLTVFAAALALLLGAGAAVAGVDIGFGADVRIDDDTSLFLAVSSRYHDRDRNEVADWSRRYFPDPDDLAVALFLSRRCDQDAGYLFRLRKEKLGWFEIANRCRVPVDAFFLPVARDPGPPYGRAYGHWRRHQKDGRVAVVLSDKDVRRLVAARMLHEYYGLPADEALRRGAGAGDVRKAVVRQYRERHGHRHDHDKDADRGKSKGRDRGKRKDR